VVGSQYRLIFALNPMVVGIEGFRSSVTGVGGAPASDRPSVELRSLEAADTGLPEDANRPPFPYESSGQLLQTNTMYRP